MLLRGGTIPGACCDVYIPALIDELLLNHDDLHEQRGCIPLYSFGINFQVSEVLDHSFNSHLRFQQPCPVVKCHADARVLGPKRLLHRFRSLWIDYLCFRVFSLDSEQRSFLGIGGGLLKAIILGARVQYSGAIYAHSVGGLLNLARGAVLSVGRSGVEMIFPAEKCIYLYPENTAERSHFLIFTSSFSVTALLKRIVATLSCSAPRMSTMASGIFLPRASASTLFP